jgi:hypothetical protein
MRARVPFTARVSVPEHVLVRDLDGESVVLSLQTEKYYGLDEVGTRMWKLLVAAETVQSAYDSLLAEYDVEPGQLRADIERLIGDLSDQGLLVVNE